MTMMPQYRSGERWGLSMLRRYIELRLVPDVTNPNSPLQNNLHFALLLQIPNSKQPFAISRDHDPTLANWPLQLPILAH